MTAAPQRALIVIDAQQEYFEGMLEIQYPSRESSLERTLHALEVADRAGLPTVVVRHELPAGAPVFAAGSEREKLHPELEAQRTESWKPLSKNVSSVLADTDFVEWLREHNINTVTLAGYMTNNCVLATAAAAEPLGFAVEVLSDATGAIHLANEAGSASAQQVHETLMTLLHSNFAAVATTDAWAAAVLDTAALPTSDLGSSAMQGRSIWGSAPGN